MAKKGEVLAEVPDAQVVMPTVRAVATAARMLELWPEVERATSTSPGA